MITGINHITLSVNDLSQSFSFYKEVLGFKPLMKRDKSAYFLAGDLWFCIEEDSKTRIQELPEYTHIAFSISQENFHSMKENLQKHNVTSFKKNTSEGDSFYFLDPNGHKLEIHVGTWKTRLEKYLNDPECEILISNTELENIR